MSNDGGAFPSSPLDDDGGVGDGGVSDHRARKKLLDHDGFLVEQSSDPPGVTLSERDNQANVLTGENVKEMELVDDKGFIVPPTSSEIEHVFERAEQVHSPPHVDLVGDRKSSSFGTEDVEDTAEVGRGADAEQRDVEAQEIEDEAAKTETYKDKGDDVGRPLKEQESNLDSSATGTSKEEHVTVRQVFQFGSGPKKNCGLALGLLCAAVSGLVYPVMAYILSNTFRVLSVPTSDQFKDDIKELAYTFMVVGAISAGSVMAQITLLETAAEEMVYSFKTRWFDALLRQDMAFFDLQDVSGTAMLISSAGARYRNGVGRKLGEGVQFFFTFLGGFVYAFYCSWSTSLVLLAVVPFMSASILFLMKTTQSKTKRANESYAEAGSIVMMALSAIRTVYALNASQQFIDRYTISTEKAYAAAASRTALLGLANGMVMGSVIFLRSGVLTLFGSYLLYDQVRNSGCDPSGALGFVNESCDPDGQSIMGALIGVTLGAAGIPQLSLALEAFNDARAACYLAVSVMERKTEVAGEGPKTSQVACSALSASLPKYEIDSSSTGGVSASSLNVSEIRFEDVSFSYPSRPSSLILENFSLSIKKGSTIGIVGPSGSGKSTICSLLERFYDTTGGSITIDGVNIKDINVRSLREHVGMVNQEPKLFATSIRNNIQYGSPGASDEQIERAARMANCHDFIMDFPNKYETLVGEMGGKLSGGQRQRIALARVLVRDRQLLLLDEFSSALDSESESIVKEALDKILEEKRDMTTLIVAHRLSTVQNADCIVVVCDGRIVETGRHEELLERKGLYHRLVQIQSTESNTQDRPRHSIAAPRNDSMIDGNGNELSEKHIVFRDVSFHYPTRPDSEVLRGLKLTIRRGETLALVGESGGGKSTIISLLERFYDVTGGSILFDGVDVKELNVAWLRHQIGLVSQEPNLFNGSIRENILYGSPGATQEEVERAAKMANAHEFIRSFPSGYDTLVGEGGSQLISGGQKQRIAIARAILRDHSVLILDEASASLDSESERLVHEALHRIMENKVQTTIVIAHRLSTIRNADRIAVLVDGAVQEIGTWDELVSRDGSTLRRMSMFQSLNGKNSLDTLLLSKNQDTVVPQIPKNIEAANQEDGSNNNRRKKMSNAKRVRLLAKDDIGLLAVGSAGAVLAGIGFPASGVLFGYLIELLYRPNPGCKDTYISLQMSESFGPPTCESIADDMQMTSFYITLAFVGVLVCTSVGNVLLYDGFGKAAERMNKRIRDAMFGSLLRQEVAYFDANNVNAISSQLQEDAAVLHAYTGEPLRTFILAVSSLLIGVIVAMYYMWPVALMAFAVIPLLAFAAKAKIQRITGQDESSTNDAENPDAVAIETLLNMRTVASLNIEQVKKEEYSEALMNKRASAVETCIKGFLGGLAQFVQFWALALLYWWGGYLLSRWPEVWEFRDFLIAIFALLISITGTALNSGGTTDSKLAEEAADRIFALIDRESAIDPLSEEGQKGSI